MTSFASGEDKPKSCTFIGYLNGQDGVFLTSGLVNNPRPNILWIDILKFMSLGELRKLGVLV